MWFAQAPDEPAMHQLWQATFGLHSSRHLTLDADTAQARREHPVSSTTPWREAPPLELMLQILASAGGLASWSTGVCANAGNANRSANTKRIL